MEKICKGCGKLKELDYCNFCGMDMICRYVGNESGKEVLARLENEIADLKISINKLTETINLHLPKKHKVKIKELF